MLALVGAKVMRHTFAGMPTVFPASQSLLMTPLNVVDGDANSNLRPTVTAAAKIWVRAAFHGAQTGTVRLMLGCYPHQPEFGHFNLFKIIV